MCICPREGTQGRQQERVWGQVPLLPEKQEQDTVSYWPLGFLRLKTAVWTEGRREEEREEGTEGR